MAAPKNTPEKQPPAVRMEAAADLILVRHREELAKELDEKQREIVGNALSVLDDSFLLDWLPDVVWEHVSHDDEVVIVKDSLDLDDTGIHVGLYRPGGEVFIPLYTVELRLPINSALELARYILGMGHRQ